MCKQYLDIMGIKGTPNMTFGVEHNIILYLSNRYKFICQRWKSGALQLAIEAPLEKDIPHGGVIIFIEETELFIHGLIQLCAKLWQFLSDEEKEELKNILEA